ncbi:unnamed protein product, partial [Iphiclides podalirius]
MSTRPVMGANIVYGSLSIKRGKTVIGKNGTRLRESKQRVNAVRCGAEGGKAGVRCAEREFGGAHICAGEVRRGHTLLKQVQGQHFSNCRF